MIDIYSSCGNQIETDPWNPSYCEPNIQPEKETIRNYRPLYKQTPTLEKRLIDFIKKDPFKKI
ncbi:hypothetical protein HNV12_00925 [Methanococcoides sp. SA1]|nr:hypothetical protein [Methanococcoides sp. SA1]